MTHADSSLPSSASGGPRPCDHASGYDNDGNCWDCGKEIYQWPAEAAPPRATTTEPKRETESAEVLLMLNQLDAVVDVLGIAESDVEPADEIRALIERNAQLEDAAASSPRVAVAAREVIAAFFDPPSDFGERATRQAESLAALRASLP